MHSDKLRKATRSRSYSFDLMLNRSLSKQAYHDDDNTSKKKNSYAITICKINATDSYYDISQLHSYNYFDYNMMRYLLRYYGTIEMYLLH